MRSYGAAVSACEKTQRWEPRHATLRSEVDGAARGRRGLVSRLGPTGGRLEHWLATGRANQLPRQEHAVALLLQMRRESVEPNTVTLNAVISACGKAPTGCVVGCRCARTGLRDSMFNGAATRHGCLTPRSMLCFAPRFIPH